MVASHKNYNLIVIISTKVTLSSFFDGVTVDLFNLVYQKLDLILIKCINICIVGFF